MASGITKCCKNLVYDYGFERNNPCHGFKCMACNKEWCGCCGENGSETDTGVSKPECPSCGASPSQVRLENKYY